MKTANEKESGLDSVNSKTDIETISPHLKGRVVYDLQTNATHTAQSNRT